MISISLDPVNVEPILRSISHIPGAIEKATRRAIKRTLAGAKQTAAQLARQRYTLPASIVRNSLELRVGSNFSGYLKSRGTRNPLDKAKTTPKSRITRRGKYIRAEVVRGQGDIIKKAFRKFGGGSVFERTGKNRFPIHKLKTVSAPQMVGHPSISKPVIAKIQNRLEINLLHEASFILRQ